MPRDPFRPPPRPQFGTQPVFRGSPAKPLWGIRGGVMVPLWSDDPCDPACCGGVTVTNCEDCWPRSSSSSQPDDTVLDLTISGGTLVRCALAANYFIEGYGDALDGSYALTGGRVNSLPYTIDFGEQGNYANPGILWFYSVPGPQFFQKEEIFVWRISGFASCGPHPNEEGMYYLQLSWAASYTIYLDGNDRTNDFGFSAIPDEFPYIYCPDCHGFELIRFGPDCSGIDGVSDDMFLTHALECNAPDHAGLVFGSPPEQVVYSVATSTLSLSSA